MSEKKKAHLPRENNLKKEECPVRDLRVEALDWSARRDLNPRSPESESVALSNCATGGNIQFFRLTL